MIVLYRSAVALSVDGPVDDVEECVSGGKDPSGVLVYGVSVYPDVDVAPGCLHTTRSLAVGEGQLGQDPLLPRAVLRYPIHPCCTGIHVAVARGHHHVLVWVCYSTCARQLQHQAVSSDIKSLLVYQNQRQANSGLTWFLSFLSRRSCTVVR